MLSCIVSNCPSNSIDNPNLLFFNFPKHLAMREEWLDVLSLKKSQINDLTKICELHFKSKDFCAGRKSLKIHAIPINISQKKSFDPDNSDDEFMQCGSDSDPEIVEVKKISQQTSAPKIKVEFDETNIKRENKDVEVEPEPSRRPSRRAAQLAVKKIQNTVRNLGLPSASTMQREPPKTETRVRRGSAPARAQSRKFRDQKVWHSIRVPPVEISLLMECHEELLSAIQVNTLMKAQAEYNNVMKKLRTLKASNARITCAVGDESEMVPPPSPTPPPSPIAAVPKIATIVSTSNLRSPNLVTLSPASSGHSLSNTITVVPVRLLTVHTSPSTIQSMKPSSPTVTLTATSVRR